MDKAIEAAMTDPIEAAKLAFMKECSAFMTEGECEQCQDVFERQFPAAIAAYVAAQWRPASEAPEGVWLLTRRAGEQGCNITMCRKWVALDGTAPEVEWIDQEGRTTVTHHSFAAPTEFQSLPEPPKEKGNAE